ncbi:TMEM175 family protein [Flavobacterium sp.]|uniref:TMEM175 family protein n=1 Tax=Flavobacterium sp. TaxID=239 RepID=UPI0038FD2AB2
MEENNNKLQIERLLFFSDAVIAIAMTLLIIEIKAPHIENNSNSEVIKNINELIPKFVSFFISFFVIAIYWKAHHHLFGYVKKYTDKLIWLNILFLLSIVLMPFSSAFYSENFHLNIPYAIYCMNIFVTGLLNCWIIRYISSEKAKIATVSGNNLWRKYYTLRSLVAPLIFFLSMLLSFYSTNLSRVCFILIFPVIYLLEHKYKTIEN